MKIDFDKLTKGALIFSFLLVAFSFFYYYVIFLPQVREEAKRNLNKCLLGTTDAYYYCRGIRGMLGQIRDRRLPPGPGDRRCEERRKQDRDDCFRKYPQK